MGIFIIMHSCSVSHLTDLLNTQSTVKEISHLTDSDIIRPRETTPSAKDILLNLPRNSEVRYFYCFLTVICFSFIFLHCNVSSAPFLWVTTQNESQVLKCFVKLCSSSGGGHIPRRATTWRWRSQV